MSNYYIKNGNLILDGLVVKTGSTLTLKLTGGTTETDGGNVTYYGGSHATNANKIRFRSGAVEALWIDGGNVSVPAGNVTITDDSDTQNPLRINAQATGGASAAVFINDTGLSAGPALYIDGSNSTATNMLQVGNVKFAVGWDGNVSIPSGYLAVGADPPAPTGGDQAYFGAAASYGAVIIGQGTTYDVTLQNESGQLALVIPTNTTNISIPSGKLGVGFGTSPQGIVDGRLTDNSTTLADTDIIFNLSNASTTAGALTVLRFAMNQNTAFIAATNNATQADRKLQFYIGSPAGNTATDLAIEIDGNQNIEIPNGNLIVSRSDASNVQSSIINTGAGGALLFINAQGTGDPSLLFRTGNTTTDWVMGIDNSAGDVFKICNASAIGVSDALIIDLAENVSIPSGSLTVSSTTSIECVTFQGVQVSPVQNTWYTVKAVNTRNAGTMMVREGDASVVMLSYANKGTLDYDVLSVSGTSGVELQLSGGNLQIRTTNSGVSRLSWSVTHHQDNV